MVLTRILPKLRDCAIALLRMFRARSYAPLQPPVKDPVLCPADPVTAVTIPEVERATTLLSRTQIFPEPYLPVKQNDGRILFPIKTYSGCFRGASASQAKWVVACSVDPHGEKALQGLQPDGETILLIHSQSFLSFDQKKR